MKPMKSMGMTLAYWISSSRSRTRHRLRDDAVQHAPAIERRDGHQVEDEEHDVERQQQQADVQRQLEQWSSTDRAPAVRVAQDDAHGDGHEHRDDQVAGRTGECDQRVALRARGAGSWG